MQYELINPSDPYTFVAKTHEIAALTVFLLSPMFGAASEDGTLEVPVFIFGGATDWYKEQFDGRTPDDGLRANYLEVADALDSMMLGRFEDRARYEAALALLDTPEKKEEFKAVWQDGRTSLNDIGSFAHMQANRLRKIAEGKAIVE